MAGFRVGTSTVGGTDPIGVADAPPPFAPDDDSWWAGSARCFVGVAIAGAVAALATTTAIAGTFEHQDEISQRVASGQGATSATNRRAQQTTGFQHWYQSDDIAPQTAQPIDDAQGWPPAVTAPPIVSKTWSVEDDLPVTAPTFAADDDWQPRIVSFTVTPLVFQADDELPNNAFGPVDEWQAPGVIERTSLPRVFADNDEVTQTAATFVGDEDTWQPAILEPAQVSITWFGAGDGAIPEQQQDIGGAGSGNTGRRAVEYTRFQRWFASDDLPVAATPLNTEDEFRPWLEARLTAPVVRLWRGEDERPTSVTPLPNEEDAPILGRSLDSVLAVVWAEGDDLVPKTQPTEDHWSPAQTYLVSPVVTLWQQQDETIVVVAPLQVEDEYWRAPPVPLVAPVTLLWSLDDTLVPQPVVDDDYARELFSVPVQPVAKVWTHQDEWVPEAIPLPVEHEYWIDQRAYPGPIVATLFQDDDLQGDFVAPIPTEPDKVHGFEMGGDEKPRRRNLVTILPDTPKADEKRKTITKRDVDHRVFEKAREQALKLISEAAEDHAANIRTQPVRYSSVRTALKPLAKALKGWDWVTVYQRMYDEALKEQIRAELATLDQMAEEDEIITLLLGNT